MTADELIKFAGKPGDPVRPKNRVFQTHRAFVRRHNCVFPLCANRDVEFAHLRSAANAGMGLKPADWYGIPMCGHHHRLAHLRGHDAVARENNLDLAYLFKTAAYLAERSPDQKMRAAMKERADG